jgi:hypothetical protein
LWERIEDSRNHSRNDPEQDERRDHHVRQHTAYAEDRFLIHWSQSLGKGGWAVRAAIYARLSDDGLSIPDQLASSRKYAEDRGWQVVDEFVDKHKSAFRKVERERFEALLSAADAGKIDAIITRAPRSSDPASRDVRATA